MSRPSSSRRRAALSSPLSLSLPSLVPPPLFSLPPVSVWGVPRRAGPPPSSYPLLLTSSLFLFLLPSGAAAVGEEGQSAAAPRPCEAISRSNAKLKHCSPKRCRLCPKWVAEAPRRLPCTRRGGKARAHAVMHAPIRPLRQQRADDSALTVGISRPRASAQTAVAPATGKTGGEHGRHAETTTTSPAQLHHLRHHSPDQVPGGPSFRRPARRFFSL